MVPYDKILLNKLLDSYERSLLSIGENVRTVNIEMRFTRKSIPAYFDESAAEYEQIHIWAKKLEEKAFITIVWKDGKVDHIIEKIRLNEDTVSASYEYVNRIPKSQYEEAMLQMLRQYRSMITASMSSDTMQGTIEADEKQVNMPVCTRLISFLIRRIEEHKPVKEYICMDDPDETKRLLDTIAGIEQNDRPLYIREFSIRVLKDSKAFEKVENKAVGIFKRFGDNFCEMELSEILAEYNIYRTPNYVYLKGNCFADIGGTKINLSVLRQGVGISGEDIDRVRIILPQETNVAEVNENAAVQRIEKVITIENLTTFFRYSEPDSLIVYLGGYHNTSRRTMLQKIYKKIPNVRYYHFGDIDAGGFQIFYDLKKKTGIPFTMLHMDLETLMKYERYGKSLTGEDKKRLRDLAGCEEIADVVNYMLQNNVKLEQECIVL